jgi:hypothetical protein
MTQLLGRRAIPTAFAFAFAFVLTLACSEKKQPANELTNCGRPTIPGETCCPVGLQAGGACDPALVQRCFTECHAVTDDGGADGQNGVLYCGADRVAVGGGLYPCDPSYGKDAGATD